MPASCRAWSRRPRASPRARGRECSRADWRRATPETRYGTPRPRAGSGSPLSPRTGKRLVRALFETAACEGFFDLALLVDVLGVELVGRADLSVDLELAHDVDLAERLGHVVGALGGGDEPSGRAHREHLDERET